MFSVMSSVLLSLNEAGRTSFEKVTGKRHCIHVIENKPQEGFAGPKNAYRSTTRVGV